MEPDKLKLKNVTVKFVNRNDSKYGKSFAVLVDEHIDGCPYDNEEDSEEVKAITKWVKENKIGKGDNAGKPQFSKYDKDEVHSTYFYFRPGWDTNYTDLDGNELLFSDIMAGSVISLTARAYPYTYTDAGITTSGVTHKLTSVVVMKMGEDRAYEDTQGLLAELLAEETKHDNEEEKTEEVDLSENPF